MTKLPRYVLPTALKELDRHKTKDYKPTGLSFDDLLKTTNGYSTLLGASTKWALDYGEFKMTGMYLSPAGYLAGLLMCHRFKACAITCIRFTGQNGIEPTNHMREFVVDGKSLRLHITQRRTLALIEHPIRFLKMLVGAIIAKAGDDGESMLIRLNGTSDIRWERILDLQALHDDWGVRFFDYTKLPLSKRQPIDGVYRLCFSYDEQKSTPVLSRQYLAAGFPVAVVVSADDHKHLTSGSVKGITDGDAHDMRFFDSGVVVLKYKRTTGSTYSKRNDPNTPLVQDLKTIHGLMPYVVA